MIKLNTDVLDTIMRNHGIPSDRQLARVLNLSPAYMSQVRSGNRGVGLPFVTAMLTELDVPFTLEAGSLYELKKEDDK